MKRELLMKSGFSVLPESEFETAFDEGRTDLLLGARTAGQMVAFALADGRILTLTRKDFKPSGTTEPDFNLVSVIDGGQTVQFGPYAASSDYVTSLIEPYRLHPPEKYLGFILRCDLLDRMGVEYRVETDYRGEVGNGRRPEDLRIFKSVKPPFTYEDWFQLTSGSGSEYIGGCCGTASGIQDYVNSWYRFDDTWVPTKDLENMSLAWVSHGEVEWESFEKARETGYSEAETLEDLVDRYLKAVEFAETDPNHRFSSWGKLWTLWMVVRGFHAPEIAKAATKRDDEDPFTRAAMNIQFAARLLTYTGMFDGLGSDGQNKAHAVALRRELLPDLKLMYDTAKDIEPYEGWAILDGNEDLARNRLGPCVYDEKDRAEEVLGWWIEDMEQYERKDPMPKHRDVPSFRIARVRLSIETGLEVLGGS